MSDINEARNKLLRQERLRPRPGQHSALWDEGRAWQQAFEELRALEESHSTRFEHLVAARQSFEARGEHLRNWSGELNDAAEWYQQRSQYLSNQRKQWPADAQGRALVPQELLNQQALMAVRAVDLDLRREVIELEFLEYRRREYGRLKGNEWQNAFASLQHALRQQASIYKRWYGADLLNIVYTQRLRWCERVHTLQLQTLQSWEGAHSVALNELQRDAAALKQLMDPWRPRPQRGSRWGAVFAAAAVVAAVIFFVNSPKKSGTEPVAVRSTTVIYGKAQAPIQAATVPVGDLITLNNQGKELLKQGQWQAALESFQAAFDADPQSHAAYEPLNNMAFCLYELNRHQEAQAKWEHALSIEPNSPDAHAGLAMELYVSGRQREGIDHYRAALAIKPNYADEEWLRTTALWSERAISDSRPMRSALGQ